jgi:NAD(P)-dependent dehydrogenase (short-subunit alcohol dehydrogenase family)
MKTADSVAVVTGGASGLGAAVVRKLHASGAHVVILDLPRADGAGLVNELGGHATFLPADVTNSEQVEEAVAKAASFGPLRITVNCAGIGTPAKVLGREGPLPLHAFNQIINVNLVGTFNVLRVAAAHMSQTSPVDDDERGVIVNTASVAAFDGQIGQAAYSASKGAIVAMTLPVAREFARHSIRVNTVAPGLFRTPLMDTLPEEAQKSLATQVPNPARLGDPSEFAALVQHIVENPYLNGETIRLDGAIRIAPK